MKTLFLILSLLLLTGAPVQGQAIEDVSPELASVDPFCSCGNCWTYPDGPDWIAFVQGEVCEFIEGVLHCDHPPMFVEWGGDPGEACDAAWDECEDWAEECNGFDCLPSTVWPVAEVLDG